MASFVFSSKRAVAFISVLLAGMLGVSTACQVLVTLDAKAKSDLDATVPGSDGALEAGPDLELDAHPACRRILPQRPPPSGAPSRGPLTLAANVWTIRSPADAGALCPVSGYDFDDANTTGADCPSLRSCAQQLDPKQFAVVVLESDQCDYPRGADNALAKLLEVLQTRVPGVPSSFADFDPQRLLANGVSNLLLEITDYNGLADDDRVFLALYGTVGYVADGGTYPEIDAAGGVPSLNELIKLPPVWDGSQPFEWIIDRSSVDNPGDAGSTFLPRLSEGYVRDHVLVIPLIEDGPFPVGLPGAATLRFKQGNLTAYLEERDGTFALTHGRMSARFTSKQILTALGAAESPDPSVQGQLCKEDDRNVALYQALKNNFCALLDLPPSKQPNDPNTPCAEFSASGLFTSVPTNVHRVNGVIDVQRSRFGLAEACPDDAGMQWCDDCTWTNVSRCPTDGGN